jgi:hypothetical protein
MCRKTTARDSKGLPTLKQSSNYNLHNSIKSKRIKMPQIIESRYNDIDRLQAMLARLFPTQNCLVKVSRRGKALFKW